MKRLVIGRGSVFADLLIIGEAPGAQEDLEGKPYVGKSGKLLNELLIKAGIDYKEDVYFCNVIKCCPPNNRKPTPREINKPYHLTLKDLENVSGKLYAV